MSLRRLLSQPVQHLAFAEGAVDEWNNPTSGWADPVVVMGRLEQTSSQERTEGRQTVTTDWTLFLHPHVVVTPQDRFVDVYGRTFEVAGAAAMTSSPRRDVLLEVPLQHVEG